MVHMGMIGGSMLAEQTCAASSTWAWVEDVAYQSRLQCFSTRATTLDPECHAVCCGCAGYLYLRTGGGGGHPAPAAGRGTAAAGQSSGGFMQQQQQQQGGFSASPQQQPAPGGQSSAFKGKAYKLGGS